MWFVVCVCGECYDGGEGCGCVDEVGEVLVWCEVGR